MSFELVKDTIYLDQKIAHETTQTLLEGDLVLPDIKPDIAYLLNVDAKCIIDKTEVGTDRITYSGRLDVSVLYAGKNSEKPVYSLHSTIPMDDFMNVDNVTSDMAVDLETQISHIDFKMVNDRKLNYKSVVAITAKINATLEKEVVSNINDIPESQIKKSHIKINKTVEHREEKFVIKEELMTPSGKPNIREILNCRVDIANKEVRIYEGHLTVKGDLMLKTLYSGDTEDSVVEFMEHEVPFNGSFDIDGLADDMISDAVLKIQDQYIQVRPDTDGEDRVLDVEVSVGAVLKVYSENTIDMVDDAYCINKKTNFAKSKINYPKVVFRNKNQFPVRHSIELPKDSPEIMQIYNVYGNCKIDDVRIIDDKVVVEGAIEATVLYIAPDDSKPLNSYHTLIPVKQTIEAKGAKESMMAELESGITHTNFNMLSPTEVEARYILDMNVTVVDEKEVNLISDVTFEELEQEVIDRIPSLAVYICQNDDSLWTIAKKYNTSIDDIIALNEIDESMKVTSGQKLMILKKAVDIDLD